jgi:O-antigen ligase
MAIVVGRRVFVLLLVAAVVLGVLIARETIDLESVVFLERLTNSAFVDSERSRLMSQAIALILENPLAGGGTEPLDNYPHNLWLESFLAVGIFSGLCFTFLLLNALINAVQILRLDRNRAWISLLFFQYAIGAMVSGSLYASNTFWVLMAAVVSQTAGLSLSRTIVTRSANGVQNA